MPIFALQYSYTDDVEALERHRPEHRAYLGGLAERGVVLASGPYAKGEPDGALVIVQADSKERVAELVDDDPFSKAGLLAGHAITEWHLIIGRWAADAD